jgi:hypothetical protein
MSVAALIPLAHHGSMVAALPFVLPALTLGAGLVFLIVRDRLGDRRNDGTGNGR